MSWISEPATDSENAELSFGEMPSADNTPVVPDAEPKPSTGETASRASLRLISTTPEPSSGFAATADTEAGSPPISQEHAARLSARCLNPILCARLGVRSIDRSTIAFDYRKNGEVWDTKLRRGKGNMPWAIGGKPLIPFNYDCLLESPAPDEELIITEGEFDAIAAVQVGYPRCISVPNGAQAGEGGFGWLYQGDDIRPEIKQFGRYIIATDGDEKGLAARDALAVRLGDARCRWVSYPDGCKDANDVLRCLGAEKLRHVIDAARPMWADEVASIDDIPDPGEEPRYRTGFLALDQHGTRITLPALMSIVGPYSSGKSIFLRQLLVNLWRLHGWRALLAAFEEKVKPRFHRDLRRHLIGRGYQPDHPWAAEEISNADDEIRAGFRFLLRPKRGVLDPLHVLKRIEFAVQRYDMKVITIDPVNEIDWRLTTAQTKTDLMGDFLKALKELADDYGLLIIVCAHTQKNVMFEKAKARQMPILRLSDAEDTRYYGNKSDIGFAMWKIFDGPTMLHVDKIKDTETMGRPTLCELEHHASMNSFSVKRIGYDILKST